jgi:phosphoenolpyruvate carboxykinase (ATP)
MSLPNTRVLVNLALASKFDAVPMERDPVFGLFAPTAAEGVNPEILHLAIRGVRRATTTPRPGRLVSMFPENFQKFQAHVGPDSHSDRAGLSRRGIGRTLPRIAVRQNRGRQPSSLFGG